MEPSKTELHFLNKKDYRTLALAALGGALEFYDFIIFVFFATVISQLFFPVGIADWLKLTQAYGIFAAGYLARPFGGIIMAHFGDKFGRKKMFSLSIFMMALPTLCIGLLPTLCIGLLPTYHLLGWWAPLLLLLMRLLQGAAVGGEVPGAWVFVSEHVPMKRIGVACGTLTAGLTAGILLGSVVTTLIHSLFNPTQIQEFGWRIPFILGGFFGLLGLYLRRFLEETPIFQRIKAERNAMVKFPLKEVLQKHYKGVMVAMLLTWVLSAGIMVIILMAPVYLETQLHVPRLLALQANSLAIIALSIGCIVYGALIDRFGAGKVLLIGSVIMILNTAIFYYVANFQVEYLVWAYVLVGLSTGVVGSFAFVMVNSFPAIVRFSGISFSFNVAYAIAGGITPVGIITLTQWTGSLMVPAYYVMLLYAACSLLGGYYWIQRRSFIRR